MWNLLLIFLEEHDEHYVPKFCKLKLLGEFLIFIEEHDKHYIPKFYKLKLLGELDVQYSIRVGFNPENVGYRPTCINALYHNELPIFPSSLNL